MCKELIFKLVGRELSDIDVIDIKPWVMHAEVAEKFVSCDNRIILAGDAAHRFPPAGGFGELLCFVLSLKVQIYFSPCSMLQNCAYSTL